MARFIQWRYVVPRVVIATLSVAAVWIGLEPVLHQFLTRIGERIIGAKVEIGKVRISLWRGELRLKEAAIANPRYVQRNLLECDEAVFDVDPRSVLARRLHVREARLSGVRLSTRRSTSGAVAGGASLRPEFDDGLDEQLAQMGKKAFVQFLDLIQQDLAEELVSLQLAAELSARWPEDYRRLQERARQLEARASALRQELDLSTRSAAATATSFPNHMESVVQLRREFRDLHEELEKAAAQMERDEQTIEIARKHDEQTLRRKLKLATLDPQQVSEYLLGQELHDHTREILGWIRLARRYWPRDVEMPPAERAQGEDIVFPGLQRQPRALVERMVLAGTAESYGHEVPWQGELENLTTDPALVGKPVILKAATQGPRPLTLVATLDRTTATPRDRVVMHFPKVAQVERTFGKQDEFALIASAGVVRVWAEIDLAGDRLQGRLLIEQPELTLSPKLPEKFGPAWETRLQAPLAKFRTLQAEVTLSGNVNKPAWKLRSNLGPQLSPSLTLAMQQEFSAREAVLAARLKGYLDQQTAAAKRELAPVQEQLLAQITSSSGAIDDLRRVVAGRVRLPGPTAKDSPLANPFLRR